MKEECLICGAPFEYLEKDELMEKDNANVDISPNK